MGPKKTVSKKIERTTRKKDPGAGQAKRSMPAPLSEAPLISHSEGKADLVEPTLAQNDNPVFIEINTPSGFLWGIAIALGFSFDFLFWKQLAGLNFLIFVALCVVGGLTFMASKGRKPALNSLLLLIPLAFFSVFTFLRREPLTLFLSYALSLFSLGVFAVSFLGGKWYLYRFSTYFIKFFQLIRDMIRRPFGLLRRRNIEKMKDGSLVKRSPLFGIVRGLLISLPIVLCLGSLLASGDLVFNQKVDEFFDGFTPEKINEFAWRLFMISVMAFVSAGVFLHSIDNSADEKITVDTNSSVKSFLDFTETSVVLVSVCVLFALFVGIQFKYFFGGETNIGVAGFTYSQYARRGFNELITVAFISLVIVVGLRGIVRLDNGTQWNVYSGLNVLLVGLVLVILVSAYQRISLGIDWHGYSRLRLYPRIFLIWLGALFVVTAALLVLRHERFFAFALVLATFGFAATVSIFNIDAAIVRHNVFRAWHGKHLNVAHLASLSSDAIPALVDEYLSPNLPEETRDGVGAILACYAYFEDNPHIFQYDWRSFDFSYYQAHIALKEVRPHLKGYIIKHDRHPLQVKTPTSVLYDCVYGSYAERREEE